MGLPETRDHERGALAKGTNAPIRSQLAALFLPGM